MVRFNSIMARLVISRKEVKFYKQYIQKLLDEGKAYYCYMSKEELEELRKDQEANKERPRYDTEGIEILRELLRKALSRGAY